MALIYFVWAWLMMRAADELINGAQDKLRGQGRYDASLSQSLGLPSPSPFKLDSMRRKHAIH